jgi:hypothetical protein
MRKQQMTTVQERILITQLTNTAIEYYYTHNLDPRIQAENFAFNVVKAAKCPTPDIFANYSMIRDIQETIDTVGFFLRMTDHHKLVQRAVRNIAMTTSGQEMVSVFVVILTHASNIQGHMIWMLQEQDNLKKALEIIAKHNAHDVALTNANWLTLADSSVTVEASPEEIVVSTEPLPDNHQSLEVNPLQ